MKDVITIGGATQDVFVRSEGAQVFRVSNRKQEKAWIGFDYGAKIPVDQIRFTVGGGATNTAVAFAKLGLEVASLIKVGQDAAAGQILEELEKYQISTEFVQRSEQQTGYSVILTSYEGERSILTYRGANTQLSLAEVNWQALKATRWFYISSLSGEAAAVLEPLLDFAAENNIQVAWNPGGSQLKQGWQTLEPLLRKVDVLFLNKEEASQLTGLPLEKPLPEHQRSEPAHAVRPAYMYDLDRLLQKLRSCVRQLVVVTDGERGTQVYDGQQVTAMPAVPVEVADVLGAGDAFGATFTTAWLQSQDLSKALRWAAVNAASVVTDPGAHFGLLTHAQVQEKLEQVSVQAVSYALDLQA